MAFDASGTFTRLRGNDSWKGDASAGTKIKSDLHDNNDNDLANGLSETITKTGKSLPVTDIPWGGFKITNLGNPTAPGDAATKTYVDTMPGWPTAKNISGADLNGRLNFTAPSGVNGITWTYADLSWVAKGAVTNKTVNRLVLNDSAVPSTTTNAGDVFVIDEFGDINNNGYLTSNISYSSADIHTIVPGHGMEIRYFGNVFQLSSNDTATAFEYQSVTLRSFFQVQNGATGTFLTLDKKDGAAKLNRISGYVAGTARWTMDLGDAAPESGARTGSNFVLHHFDNAGVNAVHALTISRADSTAAFGGALTAGSSITAANGVFQSPASACLASTGSPVFLRPNGAGNSAGEMYIDTSGNLTLPGIIHAGAYQCRLGLGGYGPNVFNIYYGSPYVYVTIDDTNMGAIAWQSDYRIKRNIAPLPSMWDRVKSLNPVKYKPRKFGKLFEDGDEEHWGMLAHELQEKLTPSVATGRKDEENTIQSVNPLTMIAVLTKALQEAMERIETLEAAA